jgi:hypothetical protein
VSIREKQINELFGDWDTKPDEGASFRQGEAEDMVGKRNRKKVDSPSMFWNSERSGGEVCSAPIAWNVSVEGP